MNRTRSFLLLALLAAGCGSTEFRSFDAVGSGDGMRFFGTSTDDVWVIEFNNKVHHSDGGDFVELTAPHIGGTFGSVCSAGPGKIWYADGEGLFRIDASGAVEDFSTEVPLEGDRNRVVLGERGVVLVEINPTTNPTTYLFDGAHFRRIAPLPPSPGISRLIARGPGDLWVQLSPYDSTGQTGTGYLRDAASGLFHFDGTAWTPGTSDGLPSGTGYGLSSARFPADNLWFGCSGLHLSQGVVLPLGIEFPAMEACAAYYNGNTARPGIVFKPKPDPIEFPAYWACDTELCATVDVRNHRDYDWHRMEWDGTSWVDDEFLGTYHDCVGIACMGTDYSFIKNELEDGTQILAGDHADKGKGLLFIRVGGGELAPGGPVTFDQTDLSTVDLVPSPDFSGSTEVSLTTCQDYCTQLQTNCVSQQVWLYASEQECVSSCLASGWPAGTGGTAAGNNFACRLIFANQASASPQSSCPSASALGGDICGGICEDYCGYAQHNCSQLYGNLGVCMTTCETYLGTAPTPNRTICKELELLRAGFDTANTATHCMNGSIASSFCP